MTQSCDVNGMVKIIGVDFSGAKADAATWVTQSLREGDGLRILSCQQMKRAELTELLASLPVETVAALDFPFSVPQEFAQFWEPSAHEMPALWQSAASMEYDQFLDLRDRFVADRGEPMRRGDLYFPECYSCLHKFNPNMVPMTFRGMQMLHQLWEAGCRVPPLDDSGRSGPFLLESMPGAVINSFGLPHKGYKNGKRQTQLREQVLDGLQEQSGISIANFGEFRDQCLESHDCLDSLVAAVAAALWDEDPAQFRCPGDSPEIPPVEGRRRASPGAMAMAELEAAKLEGWIYAPYPIKK